MFKVGVVGAGGRMGLEVCRAVTAAPDMELVAAVDPGHVGAEACGRTIVGEVNALGDLGAEVVVDFTVAEAVRHNVPHYAHQGIHAVIGTTGLTSEDLAALSPVRGSRSERHCGGQLRGGRGPADALRQAGGPAHGRGRGH